MTEKILHFFKYILALPHRLFMFPYRAKMTDGGVTYASQFLRSSSILIDLFFLFFFLQGIYTVITFSVDLTPPLEIIEKVKLKIPTSHEEKIIFNEFQKKFITTMFVAQVLQLVFLIVAVVYMWSKFGGTPGKLLLRLRVVDKDTLAYPSILQCVKRFFMFPVSVLCLFLGIIWSAFDKNAQTWHDKVANTIVIKKIKSG